MCISGISRLCRLPQWGLPTASALLMTACLFSCSNVSNDGDQGGEAKHSGPLGDSHFGFSVVYADVIDSEWSSATILGVNSQLNASREVNISDLPLALLFQAHVTRTTCAGDVTISIRGDGMFIPIDTLKVIPLSENLALTPVRIDVQESTAGRWHELTFVGRCNEFETERTLKVFVRHE